MEVREFFVNDPERVEGKEGVGCVFAYKQYMLLTFGSPRGIVKSTVPDKCLIGRSPPG